MPFLAADDFVAELKTRPFPDVLKEHVLTGLPYVFRSRPRNADTLYDYVSKQLGVSPGDVKIVGSARTGFSLNPDTFPRKFIQTSDIDVIVVDQKLFDRIWLTLLAWHYPRRGSQLAEPDANWARERRRDVYWGWFFPTKIRFEGLSFPDSLKPLRDFAARWFNVFQSLSQFSEFATRTVSGRLYRTWDHAYAYHIEGLRKIREITARSN
jgi:hypothetical protein